MIVCDIDDTLLHDGVYPIPKTIKFLNAQGQPIVIITARPESERDRTMIALHKAGVKFTKLLMKRPGLTDAASKLENVRSLQGVTLAIDNNPDMRAAYKSIGIPVLDPATIKRSSFSGQAAKA